MKSGSMVEAGVRPVAGGGVRCGISCASRLQRSFAPLRMTTQFGLLRVAEIGEFQDGKARAQRRFDDSGVDLHGGLGTGFRAESAGLRKGAGRCRSGDAGG